jgi:hypothetical protein
MEIDSDLEKSMRAKENLKSLNDFIRSQRSTQKSTNMNLTKDSLLPGFVSPLARQSKTPTGQSSLVRPPFKIPKAGEEVIFTESQLSTDFFVEYLKVLNSINPDERPKSRTKSSRKAKVHEVSEENLFDTPRSE